jgi:hypothetical protein
MTANKFTSGLPITYQAFLRSFPFNMPRYHFIAIPFKNLNLKIRKQLIVFQNGKGSSPVPLYPSIPLVRYNSGGSMELNACILLLAHMVYL